MLFSVQSISKAISYGMVLEDLGPEIVHKYVGHEPSGVAFNAICLNPKNQPHNPMINAGAIMVSSLLKSQLADSARYNYIREFWERLTAGSKINIDNSVFLSERKTAHNNFALGYMMQARNSFPEGTDLQSALEFYFMMCSFEANSE